jgi:TonB family protein
VAEFPPVPSQPRVVLSIVVALVGITMVSAGVAQSVRAPSWVPEGGPQFRVEGAVLELEGSKGWLRFERVLGDFDLDLEFQLEKARHEAVLAFHAITRSNQLRIVNGKWAHGDPLWPESAYHVRLSHDAQVGAVAGRQFTLGTPTGGPATFASRPAGDWQRLRISTRRHVLRISINDAPPRTYESLSEFAGYLMLRVESGRLKVRNVELARVPLETTASPDVVMEKQPGVVQPKLVAPQLASRLPVQLALAGIGGLVRMQAVVGMDGAVGTVRIVQSVHPDLDEIAAGAIRKWKFIPGTTDGLPVPVLVMVELAFSSR